MNRIVAIRKQSARELGDPSQSGTYPRQSLPWVKWLCDQNSREWSGRGDIYPNKVMVISPNEEPFPIWRNRNQRTSLSFRCDVIDEKDKELAEFARFTIIEPLTVIATHPKEIIYSHAPELLGRQEVKKLLEGIKEQYKRSHWMNWFLRF